MKMIKVMGVGCAAFGVWSLGALAFGLSAEYASGLRGGIQFGVGMICTVGFGIFSATCFLAAANFSQKILDS
jgi:hypothetical protein